MSDQPNAGATSERAQTWKTIHTKQTLSHPNKANMERWWRWPNDIWGPWGPKVSWHLSYRWGKTPKKTSPKKPVPTGDRTRARCVTSAHATTCSTVVDPVVVELNDGLFFPVRRGVRMVTSLVCPYWGTKFRSRWRQVEIFVRYSFKLVELQPSVV